MRLAQLEIFGFRQQFRLVPDIVKETHEQRQAADEQQRTENRIDFADDLVHRKQRGADIINENDPDCGPEQRGSRFHNRNQACRNIHEYRHYQQQNDRYEEAEYFRRDFPEGVFHQFRQIGPVVPDRHHARREIMHGSPDDIADRDNDEHDIPEHDTEDHADHRSDAGDVQELDQHVFPVGQHDIIDAVGMEFCGSLPVIGTEDPFHHPAIDHVPAEQESNTAEKPPHFYINSCFCISC